MMTSRDPAMRCLAVIPARGGSRRIPGKNIKPFAGRPAIAHAIGTARASELFERVVVSTDAAEVARVAKAEGAEVPFIRPADLSDDYATTAVVLAHALETLNARGAYDYACCLYPATPFLTTTDLRAGLDLVVAGGVGSAFAVSTYDAPIWRAFEQRADGSLAMLWSQYAKTRSQDLPETVHDAGQFYWVPVAPFLDEPTLFTETSRGVTLPRWRAHDLDTLEDWNRAELIYRALQQHLPL